MPVCHRLTTQGCVLSKFAHRPTLLHRSNTNIEYFIKMATQTEFYLSSSADLFEMISAHCFLITTLLHWTTICPVSAQLALALVLTPMWPSRGCYIQVIPFVCKISPYLGDCHMVLHWSWWGTIGQLPVSWTISWQLGFLQFILDACPLFARDINALRPYPLIYPSPSLSSDFLVLDIYQFIFKSASWYPRISSLNLLFVSPLRFSWLNLNQEKWN